MAYKQLKLWFDADLASLLAKKILLVQSDFPAKSFVKEVEGKVDALELKDRVEVIADGLFTFLGENYIVGLDVLVLILGPENEEETGMFTNFYWIMPIAKYVEKYGLNHFDRSMTAIEEITKRNTGEYTIRPFIENDPDRTLKKMTQWSKSPNRHVRRLSSEGVRPRLPWAKKLDRFIADPSPILPILENLKDDESRYVQTSVANCINDIMKDNPDIAKQLITSWLVDGISKPRKWIIQHGLRNRIKQKDPWAGDIISKLQHL